MGGLKLASLSLRLSVPNYSVGKTTCGPGTSVKGGALSTRDPRGKRQDDRKSRGRRRGLSPARQEAELKRRPRPGPGRPQVRVTPPAAAWPGPGRPLRTRTPALRGRPIPLQTRPRPGPPGGTRHHRAHGAGFTAARPGGRAGLSAPRALAAPREARKARMPVLAEAAADALAAPVRPPASGPQLGARTLGPHRPRPPYPEPQTRRLRPSTNFPPLSPTRNSAATPAPLHSAVRSLPIGSGRRRRRGERYAEGRGWGGAFPVSLGMPGAVVHAPAACWELESWRQSRAPSLGPLGLLGSVVHSF
ncbi:Hypothetical predicted protein [Marmota monax]|uniref:Uncharacterized protein n=1 Tax=Marmota monax TaxID=9995 RepID=A0A5E4B7Z5_MARMO|nr:Hypothetical predicted protein [Marmota monax]